MIWAALLFPDLALERSSLPVANASDAPELPPRALIEQQGAKRLVMSCNRAAREHGIESGQALKAAYAICPQLEVEDYDEEVQQQYLEELCLWALQYSSWVTPCMPDMVLLEIEASLNLFGGFDTLLSRLETDAQAQGLGMVVGIAPTPSAARLLARVNHYQASHHQANQQRTKRKQTAATTLASYQPLHVTDPNQLERILGELPVDFLPLDEFTQKGLRQSGIKHCMQLFRLPASALTRRFGEDCTGLLYRLLGRIPEPCPAYEMPEHFVRELDLPQEVPDTNALQFPLNRLLGALCGYLRASDRGVRQLKITLYHARCKASNTTIGFLDATANHKHLMRVTTERLATLDLPEPVNSVTIAALEMASITRSGKDLFNRSESQAGTIQQALDLLGARIGKDKIYTPSLLGDHRPEKASSHQAITPADASPWPVRPLWLLPGARPANRPLTIMSQAERIENGWWEVTDVRRDYYIAADNNGSWFWVYRERSNSRATTEEAEYFIHGLFA